MSDLVSSWVSTGPNLPANETHIAQGLGMDAVASLAKRFGITPQVALSKLVLLLPLLVDKLTPNGQVPQGHGGGGLLGDALGGLLGGRG